MEPGQRIAHYEIEAAVGRGGMGVVYRARDTKLDRVVALKFLPREASGDPEARSRFVREARAASALDHPNICTIHDISETDDGQTYIVMAYYEGRTLHELQGSESLHAARCVSIGRQLAAALGRAHEAGIVHRDLKPANVMVLSDGTVKLLDFGIAKLSAEGDATATQGTIGTVTYMSPEQLHGRQVDGRADLWALGVVLYEMLAGRNPFAAETSAGTIAAILNTDPLPLSQLRRDVPAGLCDLVERCLQRERDDRPADAAEVLRALDHLDGVPETSAPTRVTAVEPVVAGRHTEMWIGAALAAAFAVIAAITFWPSAPAPAPEPGTADADLLAVLPFAVRGSDALSYLAEGMVDLLSARLDGLGATRTVPPRVVFSELQDLRPDPEDTRAASRVAGALGASRYITGEVVQIADRLTLTVSLHDLSAMGTPSTVTVEGTPSEVLVLVDRAAGDLATASLSAPADRLQRIGALSSHSLGATRAYLEGERQLRLGLYRDAADSYDAALELDPEFALAHYRKSVVADWIDAYDVRSAAENALLYADDLPARDRSLLQALIHRRNGRHIEAEAAYRAILHRYPDEVEALLQLGEIQFHDGPRAGRPILEAYEPLTRALELEPTNANAQIHLGRLYSLRGEHEPLATLAEAYARSAPGSERLLEVQALHAYGVGDRQAQDRVVAALVGKPPPFLFYAAHGVSRFARAPEGAERILVEGGSDEPLLLSVRAGQLLEQGRFDAFDGLLASAPDADAAHWLLYRAFALTSGVMPPDPERMAALVDPIAALTPAEILASSWLPPYEDMTEAMAAFERDYTVAMLLIQTDRLDQARQVIEPMRQVEPFRGLGELHREVVAALDAELQLREGDETGALETLRGIRYQIPHAVSVRPFADGSRSRFLRAELERTHGALDVARGFYDGLDQSWSWWDTPFRAHVYQGLAKVAEAQGRVEDARVAYTRLLKLWQQADPALEQQREAARSALARLEGGSGVGA